MHSGTVEPARRERRPVHLPEIANAMIGADGTNAPRAATLTAAADAPEPAATKIAAHATIHSTVNGAATAGRRAGSIVVN